MEIHLPSGLPIVATVLTACGIETEHFVQSLYDVFGKVATVLTACGIETDKEHITDYLICLVATVLTACGIETSPCSRIPETGRLLQQYLPLAVLKQQRY